MKSSPKLKVDGGAVLHATSVTTRLTRRLTLTLFADTVTSSLVVADPGNRRTRIVPSVLPRRMVSVPLRPVSVTKSATLEFVDSIEVASVVTSRPLAYTRTRVR